MSADVRGALAYATRSTVMRRSASISLIVGTLLSVINQGGIILHRPWTVGLFAKIVFNYLVPFIVSSVSAAANREKRL